jgi:ATP-dependent RNA helicase RhlE
VTFDELNLNKPILKALADLEFEYLTPIQEQAFSPIMSGRDVVGIAQTGTGKTFAYLLPILRNLSFSDARDPRILILVPTRELVLQVAEEIKKLTKYLNLRVGAVYGGTNISTQKDIIHSGLDILVATPGRLIDLTFTGVLKLRSVQKFVIDEVDEMLNLGFRAQLTGLIDLLPAKRQNLMFSATLTKIVEDIFVDFFNNPIKIEVAAHGTPLEKIVQKAYLAPNFNTKVSLLEVLLKTDPDLSKVLVFVNSKRIADRLYESIEKLFPGDIGIIHSTKSQNFRIGSLKKFEDGNYRALIATDIIARGLDITDVTHVINFETPEVPGDYIHRIGRTGRAEKVGVAITFISPKEEANQLEIESLMKKPITMEPLPEGVHISNIFIEEEKSSILSDKAYLKTLSDKDYQGAFHEKSAKNLKVNLGGPKKRSPKFGKTGANRKASGPNMTKKSGKTRF